MAWIAHHSTRPSRIAMPVFGEFETIDDPLFTNAGHSQVRTHWRAKRRKVKGGPVYLVKAVALPSPGSAQEGMDPGRPVAVSSEGFFESVTRIQEAYRVNAE